MGYNSWDEECSVIGDKGEIGFIDFEDDRSVCSYDPIGEGPVVISVPFPFKGKPQSVLLGETSVCSITINNTTSEPIELWGVKIFCSNPANSFTLSVTEPPSESSTEEYIKGFVDDFIIEDRVLQPQRTLKIWLSCKPKDIGLHTSVVHFDVGDDRIERVVFLLVEDKVSQSLASSKPYTRARRRQKEFDVNEYVVTVRPVKSNKRMFKNRLLPYPIPKEVRELVENKIVPEVIDEGLVHENYATYFSTLINMEEIHLEEEMRCYDMSGVSMRRKGPQYLALMVPGLAERRPSLVHGDFVFAKIASLQSSDESPNPYQGYVYRVEADEVLLKFADEFHRNHWDGNSYNVRFTYNRVNMRRLYQAVHAAEENLGTDILFPSQSSMNRSIDPTLFTPFSSINEEQSHAVGLILGCRGSPPYVIHGPPGTGKTMTLVEAILQLYHSRKHARILVCAASNSAADHILEKLISNEVATVRDNEIFRLNAGSRAYDDVKLENIKFCFFEEYVFECPPLRALMQYRIIISTYSSSSGLHSQDIRRGHFSHIFLDEAGQASEPEAMVPIANLCGKETVVVLAGDIMQLGPVVFSKESEAFGLGRSYLERLSECDFYYDGDENYVMRLVRNYRCHPAILELPSKLFYNGELIPCKGDSSPISFGNLLPVKDFPVLFLGIQGCDEREGNNPSWFNRIEASKVVEIIKKLTKLGVDECDIGVITPYRQQVVKLMKVLESLDIDGVKVGSVEQFQGQEREVIIISTVRSTVKHNEFDKTYCLGFLSNPRRFNVAVTRARSLLVIIGNPHIVGKDPYWDKLLRHCSDNGSYQGCPLPEPQEFTEEDFSFSKSSSLEKERNNPPVPSSCVPLNEMDRSNETGQANETSWGNETDWANKTGMGKETDWADKTGNKTSWANEPGPSNESGGGNKIRWADEPDWNDNESIMGEETSLANQTPWSNETGRVNKTGHGNDNRTGWGNDTTRGNERGCYNTTSSYESGRGNRLGQNNKVGRGNRTRWADKQDWSNQTIRGNETRWGDEPARNESFQEPVTKVDEREGWNNKAGRARYGERQNWSNETGRAKETRWGNNPGQARNESFRKPVRNIDERSDGWNNKVGRGSRTRYGEKQDWSNETGRVNETRWGDKLACNESFMDLPKPVTNEDEWSDGWK